MTNTEISYDNFADNIDLFCVECIHIIDHINNAPCVLFVIYIHM